MGEIEKDRLERGGMPRRRRVGGACISPGSSDAAHFGVASLETEVEGWDSEVLEVRLTGPAGASARAGEGEEDSRTQGIWWCFDLSNRAVDGALYKKEKSRGRAVSWEGGEQKSVPNILSRQFCY